jgi:hypothetical protein
MHGRYLTEADCCGVNFHGRRGSIDRLIEHANLINSFSGFMPRWKRSALILRSR